MNVIITQKAEDDYNLLVKAFDILQKFQEDPIDGEDIQNLLNRDAEVVNYLYNHFTNANQLASIDYLVNDAQLLSLEDINYAIQVGYLILAK